MDYLGIQRKVPAMFPDFEHMFLDQCVPLDNKNIAQDKILQLQ